MSIYKKSKNLIYGLTATLFALALILGASLLSTRSNTVYAADALPGCYTFYFSPSDGVYNCSGVVLPGYEVGSTGSGYSCIACPVQDGGGSGGGGGGGCAGSGCTTPPPPPQCSSNCGELDQYGNTCGDHCNSGCPDQVANLCENLGVDIQVSPSVVHGTESFSYSWTSTGNPTTCTLTSPQTSGMLTSGSETIPPGHQYYPTAGNPVTTFSVSCTKDGTTVSDSATVTYQMPPISIDVQASPSQVDGSQSILYSWTSTGSPTTCSIESPVVSGVNGSGDGSISPTHPWYPAVGSSLTLTYSCEKEGYTARDSATVTRPSPTCSQPLTETRSLSCPTGETGSVTQVRTKDSNCTWGSWATTTTLCNPVTCAPTSVNVTSCGDGYTGFATTTTTYSGTSCTPTVTTVDSCTLNECTPTTSCQAQGKSCGSIFNGCEYVTCGNACPAGSVISVNTNVSSAGWALSPVSYNGIGNNSYTAYPNPSTGTTYTITPALLEGYQYPPTVTNNITGNTSSILLFPGTNVTFSIAYTAGTFNYSLSNGGNIEVTKGGADTYGQNLITKTLTAGTGQPVSLSVTGLPEGITYAVSNQNCTPTCQSSITFTVTPAAHANTYPLTVTGSPLSKTTSFNLQVKNSPNLSVTCVPSPSTALVGQPVTWTANVNGGTPPFTYTWTGSGIPTNPAPKINPYSVTYSTVGQKTAQVTVRDSVSKTATCATAGTVQIDFNPSFEEF